jgi:hypothetical protein
MPIDPHPLSAARRAHARGPRPRSALVLRVALAVTTAAVGCSSEEGASPTLGLTDAGTLDAGGGLDSGAGVDAGAGCAANECLIDGACAAPGAASADNPCLGCVPAVSTSAWSPLDGAACDDGVACTDNDNCRDGACVGTTAACDDGNPCTDDSCDEDGGGCVSLPNAVTCTDGNLCTLNDACDGKQGKCAAGPVADCDDGLTCTNDFCDPATGCEHKNISGACNDGDACTGSGTCDGSTCVPGALIDCDDGDVCTVDGCDPTSGCVYSDASAACDDDNPCTDDSCDPTEGCLYAFNSKKCDDGKVCTELDVCTSGACVGAPVNIDDGNPCTTDSCVEPQGVLHVPNTLPCDDGNACTVGDVCENAACLVGPDPLDCTDDNPCTTDDICDSQTGCLFLNNTLPCDDGSVCTQQDGCDGGVCVGLDPITCDDGNACTVDTCDKVEGCVFTLIVSNDCRPTIVVDTPARGATIEQDDNKVTVSGSVVSGAGPITTFKLNGADVPLGPGGTFSTTVDATQGGNTLVFEAEDSMGSPRKRVQAFLWSTAYSKPTDKETKQEMIDPGLAFYLSKEGIDDGDHSLPPNDLATIFEILLGSFDISGLLPNPLFKDGGTEVSISNLTYGAPKVTLTPDTGVLKLDAVIPDLNGDLSGTAQLLFTININGTLTIDQVAISATLVPSVVDNKLKMELQGATATIGSVSVQINGILGFLISPIVNAVVNGLKPQLEQQFSQAINDALAPALEDALNALAFAFEVPLPKLDGSGNINVSLITDFSDVIFKPSGGRFDLRAGAFAEPGNSVDNKGVPLRMQCGTQQPNPMSILEQYPLELGLADDTLNQLLWAAWRGGLLEFVAPPELLGGVDLSAFGITDLKLTLKGLLAPTATDCNESGELIAHIGDLRIDGDLKLFGQQMNVVVWVTTEIGVTLAANAEGITLGLTDVKSLETEVNVEQESLIASEGAIADLLAGQLVDGLLGALGGGALGTIPLPVIDLSGALPGVPPGTGIAIAPEAAIRKDGNTIIGGKLK